MKLLAPNQQSSMHLSKRMAAGKCHLPVVDCTSATACTNHMGWCMHRWHDFFEVEDVLVPWAPGREAMEGAACRRMDFQAIDLLLHKHFSFSWNDVDAMGVHKVDALAVPCRSCSVFLALETPLCRCMIGGYWAFRATSYHFKGLPHIYYEGLGDCSHDRHSSGWCLAFS